MEKDIKLLEVSKGKIVFEKTITKQGSGNYIYLPSDIFNTLGITAKEFNDKNFKKRFKVTLEEIK